MRIHIVGAGVVGKATGHGFARFGHEVVYTDKGDDHSGIEADIHMVCTPEDVAPQIVRELARSPEYSPMDGNMVRVSNLASRGVIVVRSSVPPGTCRALGEELHRPIFHNPEFLRESTAEQDFLEAHYAIVGFSSGSDEAYNSVRQLSWLYHSMRKEIVDCLAVESEMLKLVNNAYLHTLISFWNEMQRVCQAVGVNSHAVARLAVKNDSRVQAYGALRHGPPGAGGKCLPKDREQLLRLAREKGVEMPLLEAVKRVNQSVGGT